MQIIGVGKMGQAVLSGIIASSVLTEEQIHCVDVSEETRAELQRQYPKMSVASSPKKNEDTILAVKPQHILSTCKQLGKPSRVLSIAAGISTTSIESALPPGTPVLRAMPNTPALVGKGVSALCRGATCGDEEYVWGKHILSAVGTVVSVAEEQIDAVTGLSGSGPAYIFFIAEAMEKAGVSVGLSAELAKELAYQTLIGSAQLLEKSSSDAVELRSAVTTPNGTTAAGIAVLENERVSNAFTEAIHAATERSKVLGSETQN